MPAVLFAVFIDLLGFGIIFPILPFLALKFGGSPATGMALVAIYSLGTFLSGPIWGRLSDRFGRRRVLAVTFGCSVAAYLLLAFSSSLTMLFVARGLSGITAGNIGIIMATMADLTTEQNRGKAMGYVGATFGFGFSVGPLVGGTLGTVGGEPSVLIPGLIASVFSFLAMLMTLRFIPETTKADEEPHAEVAPQRVSWLAAVASPGRRLLLFMFMFVAIGQSISFSVIPFWTNAVLGWSAKEVGFLLGAIGLCNAVIQSVTVGPLFRRFGEAKSLMFGVLVQLAGCTILIAGPARVMTAIVAIPLIIGGLTLAFPALNSLLSHKTGRKHQGAALGMANGLSALGRVFGPLTAGLLFTASTADRPFYVVATIGFATVLWTLFEIRKAG